jgi:hypothetical protein
VIVLAPRDFLLNSPIGSVTGALCLRAFRSLRYFLGGPSVATDCAIDGVANDCGGPAEINVSLDAPLR